ncbi:FecR family protein [Methylomonas sp. SURF-1]|uniref:FecR family protein n=1 Tax=Methylomonas aurea TaxID=2952224 RepID=A0ABT1UGD2_9GAMM|nr:FecR family protein [Methylomonas sp. SURF-1]MCQ8181291.1 FecR family protein [Methylomonas sp. SURF-1]
MKRFLLPLCVGIGLTLSTAAFADDNVIGYIKTSTDETAIIGAGNKLKAGLGSAVRVGDIIKTDANGSAGLTLKDNTVLSIGPNTELKIEAYQFLPEQDRLELSASLLSGTLQYISGVIAKLKPEAVRLNTPTGVIAVRGTRFLVKIAE